MLTYLWAPKSLCCLAIYHIKRIFSSYWDRHCSGALKVTLSTEVSKALGTQQAWVQIHCKILRPLQNWEQLQSLHLLKWGYDNLRRTSTLNRSIFHTIYCSKTKSVVPGFWPYLAIKSHNIFFFSFTHKYQVSSFKKINTLPSSLKFRVCSKAMYSFTKKKYHIASLMTLN